METRAMVLVFVSLLLGCGNDAAARTGGKASGAGTTTTATGTATSTGTGTSTGTATGTGTSTDTSTDAKPPWCSCIPDCLYDLVAYCGIVGNCTAADHGADGGVDADWCWPGGASAHVTVSADQTTSHLEVYLHGGKLCYTADMTTAGDVVTTSVVSGDGKRSATITGAADGAGSPPSIACGGTTAVWDCQNCAVFPLGCTMKGACTAP